MSITIKTKPTMVDGSDWNTTTYITSVYVPLFGGTTDQFDVDLSGNVLMANGISVNGDKGFIFPGGSSVAYNNPYLSAGAIQATFVSTAYSSSTASSPTLAETIYIGAELPSSIQPSTIRLFWDSYTTNTSEGGGGYTYVEVNGVIKHVVINTTTSYSTYSVDVIIRPSDTLNIYTLGRTYTYLAYTSKSGPVYRTRYHTSYIKNIGSSVSSTAYVSTYPNLIST